MCGGFSARFNLALMGRGKKNWKSADHILAALYRLLVGSNPNGHQCYVLANDLDQANDDLELAKKLVSVNPILDNAVKVTQRPTNDGTERVSLKSYPPRMSSAAMGKLTYLPASMNPSWKVSFSGWCGELQD
jgi:hypothetical protein